MPTMRVLKFAKENNLVLEVVIDAMEAIHKDKPKEFTSRHPNTNITEEGQAAVLEFLAGNNVARPDGKPELDPTAPADSPMRIEDFAEEVGRTVEEICAELEFLGEPTHHSANISPDAQDMIREKFASESTDLEVLTDGPGEAVLETDPDSEVPGTLEETEPEPRVIEFDHGGVKGSFLNPAYKEPPASDGGLAETAEAAASVANQAELEEATAKLAGFDVPAEVVPVEEAVAEEVPATPGEVRERLILHPTPEQSLPEFFPQREVVPAEDRFAFVTGTGQPTGEFELLPPEVAAHVRETLGNRKLMNGRLEEHRMMYVFTSWPDGQKYEVPWR